MKLISLKITNIASIENAELHFDREPIASEPLFLICGPTGAGKTTILNAICLALYNKVPSLLASGTTDDDRYGVANNHPSQLLRRGSGRGEVELAFVGNDGKKYIAAWEARRARNSASGAMRPIARRLDALADGSSLTRVRDIEEAIKRIVGLTYDQFVRTTLLAQGQFSAFIKAKEGDKADILEKLTGTELYARIGTRVFEHARQASADVDLMKARIEGISLLSPEEQNTMNERAKALGQSVEERTGEIAVLDQKIQWLRRDQSLRATLLSNVDEFDKVRKEISSPVTVDEARKIDLWDATVEIRRMLEDLRRAEDDVKILKTELSLLGEREAVFAAEEEASKAVEIQKVEVGKHEAAVKNYDMSALTKLLMDASNEQSRLAKAEIALQNWSNVSSEISRFTGERDEYTKQIEQTKALLSQMRAERPALDLQVVEWTAIRNARLDLNSHIIQLRERFAETGECPLCGSKVDSLHDDASLDNAMKVVQSEYESAVKRLDNLDRDIMALSTKIKMLMRAEAELSTQLSTRKTALSKIESELKAYNIDPQEEGIVERHSALKKEAKRKGEDVSVKISEAKLCLDQLQHSRGILASLQDKKERAMLAARKFVSLYGKLENAESAMKRKSAEIDAWYESGDIDRRQVEAIESISREEITAFRERKQALADRMRRAEGAVKAVSEQVDAHASMRPEIPADTTVEEFARQKSEIEKTRDAEMAEKASLETRIAENVKNEALVADSRQRLSELCRIRDNWTLLDKSFGGADGKRFRNMAQSYVLRVLLQKSNHYMSRLLPRYRLDCEDSSLTINVIDSYQNDSVRAVGLLSGGESFIVSLALALGLSAIAKDKIDVDTLFIDEGFGSLDRDTLDIVLDALDRLYLIGGRRIGLISHVESMMERIPVRIEVSHTSPSSSSVKVVSL